MDGELEAAAGDGAGGAAPAHLAVHGARPLPPPAPQAPQPVLAPHALQPG